MLIFEFISSVLTVLMFIVVMSILGTYFGIGNLVAAILFVVADICVYLYRTVKFKGNTEAEKRQHSISTAFQGIADFVCFVVFLWGIRVFSLGAADVLILVAFAGLYLIICLRQYKKEKDKDFSSLDTLTIRLEWLGLFMVSAAIYICVKFFCE